MGTEINKVKKDLIKLLSDIVSYKGKIKEFPELSTKRFFVDYEENIDDFAFLLIIEDRKTKAYVRWTMPIQKLLNLTEKQIKREMKMVIKNLKNVKETKNYEDN